MAAERVMILGDFSRRHLPVTEQRGESNRAEGFAVENEKEKSASFFAEKAERSSTLGLQRKNSMAAYAEDDKRLKIRSMYGRTPQRMRPTSCMRLMRHSGYR